MRIQTYCIFNYVYSSNTYLHGVNKNVGPTYYVIATFKIMTVVFFVSLTHCSIVGDCAQVQIVSDWLLDGRALY